MAGNPNLVGKLQGLATQISDEKGWTIVRALPPGGTSAVFEVQVNDTTRALKVYDPSFLEGDRGEATRRRFALMIEKLKGHSCEYLVQIYDGGEIFGTLYLLMDRVRGHCLSDVLDRVPRASIRRIIDNVARAAKFLEGIGLCHRDIKSDNIVVSEDFARATLLDLGVIRQINDESAGTDDGGQLPFVATARYSSPEYMFRLVEPSQRLWQGLTFYQLGAVLYDLITRRPIFEEVVSRSRENRYLIAHAVATLTPVAPLDADVPTELAVVAQRCLEKDLDRRLAAVRWEDFIYEDGVQRRKFEVMLGLDAQAARTAGHTRRQVRFNAIAQRIESIIDGRLTEKGLHAKHSFNNKSPYLIYLSFSCQPPALPGTASAKAIVELLDVDGDLQITVWAELVSRANVIWSTLKIPACTVAMPIDDSIPPSLVECTLDAVLAALATIAEQTRIGSVRCT